MTDPKIIEKRLKPVRRPQSYHRDATPKPEKKNTGINPRKNDETFNRNTLYIRNLSLSRSRNVGTEDTILRKLEKETINKKELFQTNQPKRMEIPSIFNIPHRNISAKRKEYYDKFLERDSENTKTSDLSFTRVNNSNFVRQNQENAVTKDPKLLKNVVCNEDFTMLQKIKDLNILSNACKRAGKEKEEARCYYSMGVLFDNMGKYKEAIEHYRKFTHICRSIKDIQGEALGYNALGADYQMLGKMENLSFYEKAIEFHIMHRDIANNYGKTIASLNLAQCYCSIGNKEQEKFHSQNAFKFSTIVANIHGQVAALGTLGKLGLKGANNQDIEEFVKKYLTYSKNLDHKQGVLEGHLRLGLLRGEKGDTKTGSENLKKAFELAQEAHDTEKTKIASCTLGIIQAQSKIESFQRMMRSAYDEGV